MRNPEEISKWVRTELARVNPYTDKLRAHLWAVGFLSSIIASLIWADSKNLISFRLAVAAKLKEQDRL